MISLFVGDVGPPSVNRPFEYAYCIICVDVFAPLSPLTESAFGIDSLMILGTWLDKFLDEDVFVESKLRSSVPIAFRPNLNTCFTDLSQHRRFPFDFVLSPYDDKDDEDDSEFPMERMNGF